MKNKVIWFVIGFITASLLTMKLLGQVKGYEEHQKVLVSEGNNV